MKSDYKLQFILASIPFLGVVPAWIMSWIDIHKTTNSKKYVFIHGALWLLFVGVLGALLSLEIVWLMPKWEECGKIICIASAFIICLLMGYSSIWLKKCIIEFYNKKMLS